MKKLVLFLALLLPGCAVWDAYTTAHFDNQEYSLVNKVRTIAEHGSCQPIFVESLYLTTLELKNYTQYIPHNDKTIDLTNNLFKIVVELRNKSEISPTYCKAKLNTIGISAEEIQRVVGGKTR